MRYLIAGFVVLIGGFVWGHATFDHDIYSEPIKITLPPILSLPSENLTIEWLGCIKCDIHPNGIHYHKDIIEKCLIEAGLRSDQTVVWRNFK